MSINPLLNLEAVNINAKNEKVAYAENSLNILSKTYKEVKFMKEVNLHLVD